MEAYFVLKTQLPTIPTKTSELTNDSNFMAADDVDEVSYTLQKKLKICDGDAKLIIGGDFIRAANGDFILDGTGIIFASQSQSDILTAGGTFVKMSNFVLTPEYNKKIELLETSIARLEVRIAALEAKHPEAAA